MTKTLAEFRKMYTTQTEVDIESKRRAKKRLSEQNQEILATMKGRAMTTHDIHRALKAKTKNQEEHAHVMQPSRIHQVLRQMEKGGLVVRHWDKKSLRAHWALLDDLASK